MQEQTHSKQLKRRFTFCLAALLATALAVGSAVYAWYVYNTERHTTNVRMAAGTGANLPDQQRIRWNLQLCGCAGQFFRTVNACVYQPDIWWISTGKGIYRRKRWTAGDGGQCFWTEQKK